MDTLETRHPAVSQITLSCLCGETRSRAKFRKTTGLESAAHAILECEACGTFRTSPSPIETQNEAKELYQDPEYFAGATLNPGFWMSMQLPILRDIQRFRRGGKLLDIGCGQGFLAAAAKEAGFKAEGIDLNPHCIAEGRRRFPGVPLICGALDASLEPSYDVIVANHVIEHIVNPGEFLTAVKAKLSAEGILVLGMPNLLGGIPRFIRLLNHLPAGPGSKWKWFGYQLRQHVWHFTPEAIRTVLEANGWTVLQVRRDANMHYGALELPKLRYRALKTLFKGFEILRWGDDLRVVCQPTRTSNPSSG